MKKTTLRQNVTNIDRTWFVVDAEGKNLGHLATAIATVLRGKNRVDFTPHVDGGDYIVVLNSEKIQLSGNKEEQKMYYRHSRYLGNLKTQSASVVRTKNPTKLIRDAVSGMLARTKHRKEQLLRLYLVIGSKNPHQAQNPIPLPIDSHGK
ncbi:50S ribosomal protein L13 [Candidatus Gracilibacteria bacterium]|nr:50S ribosomal protein L13 [Candidatus Gracilibacteria bacterium]